MFSTISQWSEFNANLYKTYMRPWVRMAATREVADTLVKLSPLRMQRQLFSESFPLAPLIRQQAAAARAARAPVDEDNPLKKIERDMAEKISTALDDYRVRRDARTVSQTRQMFGPNGMGAWLKPQQSDAEVARERAERELDAYREAALAHIGEGGFAEAVCRIVVAGMISIGAFERRSLRLARLLAQLPNMHASVSNQTNWVQLLKEQARVAAVAPIEALNALEQLLPDSASRERALAVAAAVMMIEPTLANPRSEIIEFLIGTLGVDPQRVIALARQLTETLEAPMPTPTTETRAAKPKKASATAKAKKVTPSVPKGQAPAAG